MPILGRTNGDVTYEEQGRKLRTKEGVCRAQVRAMDKLWPGRNKVRGQSENGCVKI